MKKIFLLFFLFISVAGSAQSGHQQAFDDFLKQIQGEFTTYEKQINYEFAETLRNQWEEFQVFQGEEVPARPKPKSMPAAASDAGIVSCVIQGTPAPVENSIFGTIANHVIHKWLTWQSKRSNKEDINKARQTLGAAIGNTIETPKVLKRLISFYNTPAAIDVPHTYTSYRMAGNTEGDVADFWTYLAESDFEYVVKQVAEFADEKGLENWSLLKYVETVSDNVYTDSQENEKEVFTVFLANQLGLDVKIGRANEKLVALFSIAQKVYEWLSIKIEGKKYYFRFDDEKLTSLYTYRTLFSEEVCQIDLLRSMPDLLSPPARIQTRTVRSLAFDCEMEIPLDTNLCHFISEFPRVRCDIPAMSEVNSLFARSLYDTMYPKVKDLGQFDAVHLLMKFMHNDFGYATDQDQFGYEKPFFCEENFMYPFNDCEDRSILFSYLIKHILGMDVILLDYPGHITTAVAFDEDIDGAYLDFEGKRYYVCDPTYLDSLPGMAHPDYIELDCKILKI
ncbi:MAG: hypothetical protein IKY66_04080 [Bacteroidales bacterium]|nr:hypothetical protein [Bacteroidales bacterium]